MLTSVSKRQTATVRRGRAVEKRTRRASDRPPGGVARAEVSVVNGSRLLADAERPSFSHTYRTELGPCESLACDPPGPVNGPDPRIGRPVFGLLLAVQGGRSGGLTPAARGGGGVHDRL